MDRGTVLRKTEKGLEEMATRAYKLPQRSRSVLIVVDGKLSRAALLERTVNPAEAGRVLDELVAQGFVEPITGPASAPAQMRPGVTSDAPTIDLDGVKRKAVSAAIEALGPDGDMMAMQIEKCRTADELLAVIDRSHDVIRRARGEKAAAGFAKRCGAES